MNSQEDPQDALIVVSGAVATIKSAVANTPIKRCDRTAIERSLDSIMRRLIDSSVPPSSQIHLPNGCRQLTIQDDLCATRID